MSAMLITEGSTSRSWPLVSSLQQLHGQKLVDVLQCGMRVNAEVGGCVCGG